MSVILEKFRHIRGTPKKLRNLADVAVLLTNDVKDSCGASYGHAYRNGWTFSVAARDCALSQLTFSQGISHNFGADDSSGFLLNQREKKEFVGVPANYMHFNTNIARIAALGDESCICYQAYSMVPYKLVWHAALNESCFFHWKGKAPNMLDFQKLNKPKKHKKKNDIRIKTKKQDKRLDITRNQGLRSTQNLYRTFLNNRQKLFENYIKTAQKLFRNYLKDAHSKIHKIH